MTIRKSAITTRPASWYGWIFDLPDQRDHLYAKVHAFPKELPAKVDLSATRAPIENQRQLGSCLELKNKHPLVDLSRLFIYHNERVIEHSVKHNAGAMLRDGTKTLAKQGVSAKKLWPYVIKKFTTKPVAAFYSQTIQHTVSSYQRLATTQEMRACLADGYSLVFGFTVYESFESDVVASTGTVPMPSERVLGDHAICAIGYDDKTQRLIVLNSWGADWGRKCYCTMPYAYMADRNLSDDFWTMRKLAD